MQNSRQPKAAFPRPPSPRPRHRAPGPGTEPPAPAPAPSPWPLSNVACRRRDGAYSHRRM